MLGSIYDTTKSSDDTRSRLLAMREIRDDARRRCFESAEYVTWQERVKRWVPAASFP
jgi:hypothetical protein